MAQASKGQWILKSTCGIPYGGLAVSAALSSSKRDKLARYADPIDHVYFLAIDVVITSKRTIRQDRPCILL